MAMPLVWNLYFKLDNVESVVACDWISHTWVNLGAHYSKKTSAAVGNTMRLAEGAIKTEKDARQELHAISAHKRLAALVVNLSVEELHDLLAWITLKERMDLTVRLVRYSKDDASDGVVITEATFKKSFPLGQRFIGANNVFDFQLGHGVDWEDSE